MRSTTSAAPHPLASLSPPCRNDFSEPADPCSPESSAMRRRPVRHSVELIMLVAFDADPFYINPNDSQSVAKPSSDLHAACAGTGMHRLACSCSCLWPDRSVGSIWAARRVLGWRYRSTIPTCAAMGALRRRAPARFATLVYASGRVLLHEPTRRSQLSRDRTECETAQLRRERPRPLQEYHAPERVRRGLLGAAARRGGPTGQSRAEPSSDAVVRSRLGRGYTVVWPGDHISLFEIHIDSVQGP